jgi:hypothetical protein
MPPGETAPTPSPDKFQRLQELLLDADRSRMDDIRLEIQRLRTDMVDPEEIRGRISPFLQENIQYLRTNFPDLFGPVLADTIKQQIRDSQDEMVDALYPIIGKLIRKFVAKEIELFSERLEQSINEAFSLKSWWRRAKGWFSGEQESTRMMRQIARPVVQEIFTIERNSGLLLGQWSRTELSDRDMVAGMLTAIKSFVESAFQSGAQDLEMIEYEHFKIILQNFKTYYIAVTLEGPVTAGYRSHLTQTLFELAESHPLTALEEVDHTYFEQNSQTLAEYVKTINGSDQ